MCSTPPTPSYVRFHDTYLRKYVVAVD
jgi:hypothetical protein